MGEISRTLAPRYDWPEHTGGRNLRAEYTDLDWGERTHPANLDDECDLLGAARAIVLGVALSGILWVAILWTLL